MTLFVNREFAAALETATDDTPWEDGGLLGRLDAVLQNPHASKHHHLPCPAFAYVRDLDRVVLINWRNMRIPLAIRRVALANAQHDNGYGTGDEGGTRDEGQGAPAAGNETSAGGTRLRNESKDEQSTRFQDESAEFNRGT